MTVVAGSLVMTVVAGSPVVVADFAAVGYLLVIRRARNIRTVPWSYGYSLGPREPIWSGSDALVFFWGAAVCSVLPALWRFGRTHLARPPPSLRLRVSWFIFF